MYVSIPEAISLVRMYSSLLCERLDSPGPIFIASISILIQLDVVGEENVSMPKDAAVLTSGLPFLLAEDLLVSLRAFRSLLHTA